MKKNLLRSLLAIVLTALLLMSAVSCVKDGKTDETTNSEQTESTNETEEETSGGQNKTTLGSVGGGEVACYLKLDGIEGDSTHGLYEKWIEVVDFSCGIETEYSTEEGVKSSRGTFSPITFTHMVDSATPKLQQFCMNGSRIYEGRIEVIKGESWSSETVCSLRFESARIVNTAVKTVSDGNGGTYLLEEVTMTVDDERLLFAKNVQNAAGKSGMNYYVKLDGIEGECTVSEYNKWIDVIDFSHGAYQQTVGSYPAIYSGYGYFGKIVFTHAVDDASPAIMLNAEMGRRIESGEFRATKNVAGKEVEAYRAAFENLIVVKSEIKTVTDENGKTYVVEEVTLLADKETWAFTPIGIDNTAGGKTEASFDQSKRG